jgi:dTDP-glucose pyrophosphorylase
MADLQLVIMAAGMGSRFGSLKQIEGIGPSNEFLMDYAIYDAYQAGLRDIRLVVRESFLKHIQDHMSQSWKGYKDLRIHFVCQELTDLPEKVSLPVERSKPWGTGHVLYVLRKHVEAPFIIINADDFYGREGISTLASFMSGNSDKNALVGYPLQKTLSPYGPVTRGVCDIRNGHLMGIEEVQKIYADDPRTALASMNLWGFSPKIFPLVEERFHRFLAENITNVTAEYQIPQMVNDLLKDGEIEVEVLPTDSDWFGVTYKEDKEQVQAKINALIERGVYPKNLFSPR